MIWWTVSPERVSRTVQTLFSGVATWLWGPSYGLRRCGSVTSQTPEDGQNNSSDDVSGTKLNPLD